jgi:SAM-dependent methyltransferase
LKYSGIVDTVTDLDRLTVPEVDVGQIRNIAHAAEMFYVLCSAVELGIFDNLQSPKNVIHLAGELGLHQGMTQKLCASLEASGFLRMDQDGKYALTDLSNTFLVTSSPLYQGHHIQLMKRRREEMAVKLSEVIKEGPSVVKTYSGDLGIFDRSFTIAMAEYALGGCLQRTVEVLKTNSDFMKAKRSLDLGGGHGLYSIAFSRLNPELEAFVFDLPTVIDEYTREIVSVCDGKVKLLSGDMTKDDLGSDYDVVFVSEVLYGPKESINLILKKINASLKEGGILISKHFHQDEIYKDTVAVLFDLMFSLVRGVDHGIYPTIELCHLIESNGFSVVQIKDISTFSSPSRIIIAKKIIQ